MLDNQELISEKDPEGALQIIADAPAQTIWEAVFANFAETNFRPKNIVLAGMGGSCLAGLIAKQWFEKDYSLSIPFEVSRNYTLPSYINESTLVIAFSVSGNTEETISSLRQAQNKHAYLVIVTAGGKMLDIAKKENVPYIQIAKVAQPRYGIIMHLRALAKIFETFAIISGAYDEISRNYQSMKFFAKTLSPEIPTENNFAKTLANKFLNKYPIVYASSQFAPLAYKWKISFNENAKNVAWWNEFSEFNHNEFIGWTTTNRNEKFAIFELQSPLDYPQIQKRFDLTNKLLSDNFPSVISRKMEGKSYILHALTELILADFTTIYLAILKGVDPTPVGLVEDLKKDL